MCLFDVSTRELKEMSDTDSVCSSCYIVLVYIRYEKLTWYVVVVILLLYVLVFIRCEILTWYVVVVILCLYLLDMRD